MGKIAFMISATVFWALSPTSIAYAQVFPFIACMGEYQSNCAGAHTHFIPCCPTCNPQKPSDQFVAASICTVQTAQGPIVRPHQYSRIHTKGGNYCGYALIQGQCN